MIRLGCVADDFTGGSDVAATLRRAGLTVTLQFGTPNASTPPPSTDAVVVALKTRTIAPDEAVNQTLEALSWLQRQDVQSVYFKYCSTFDSTDQGNIGPVTDALREALDVPMTVACPASPEHGRTTYLGHLFVGDRLLSESSMRHHPLTPMTDPDLVRVLARQTDALVGLLPLSVIREGRAAIRETMSDLREHGTGHVIIDATDDDDLREVASATTEMRLHTGGAGLAGAIAAVLSDENPSTRVAVGSLPVGPSIILAGSCSQATLAQVAAAAAVFPAHRLDPTATPDPAAMQELASSWLAENWANTPLVIYSSAGPEDRHAAVQAMGPHTAEVLERTLAQLACEAVTRGAVRVVVAGGETSGAVVQALGVEVVEVASEADRGVPWCLTPGESPVALLLKSGNFGSEDLLVRATREQTR